MTSVGGPRVLPALEELAALPTALNAGETLVLKALLELGPHWHVFVQPRLAMAQPDFVALHRDHGLWVIEVKDWTPEAYRAGPHGSIRSVEVLHDGRWLARPSPVKQVRAYQKTFQDRFFVDHAASPAPTHRPNVLLVLPKFTSDQGASMLGHFPLVTGDTLSRLPDRLMSASGQCLAPSQVTELMRWLGEPELVSDQRLPLQLSREAERVAANPTDTRVRRIRGPAGSGKSLALASRAIVLAEQGKSVLIATYNITLVHYLHDLCARAARQRSTVAWQQSVSFSHFHGMLSELMEQVEPGPSEHDSWEAHALASVRSAYSEPTCDLPRFDAILVDEGQDFESGWWGLLRECLLRPDGELLLVADRTQNLFRRDNWTDGPVLGGGFSGPWGELKGTYRMPVDLVPVAREFAQRFLPEAELSLPTVEQDHPALAEAHRSTHRRWSNVSELDVVSAAADEVIALITQNTELSPSDIVLLADHAIGAQVTDELRRRGTDSFSVFAPEGSVRTRLKRAFWAGRPGIKGCTVHSFKGWESRAVVCVPSRNASTELYIAMTRVKGAPSRAAFVSVINAVEEFQGFKTRFERDILPSEVPALAGQQAMLP